MAPSRAVLFDLDGTLADTAADLGAAVNHLRRQRGLNELPVNEVRPYASMGARGLLRVGFGLSPEDPGYLPLRNAFLAASPGESSPTSLRASRPASSRA